MAFRWPWRRRQEPEAATSAPARPAGEWRWLPPMRPTFGDGPLTLRTDPPGVLHRLPVVPPEMSTGGVAGRASGLVTVSSGRLPGGVGSLPLRHPVRLGPVPDDVVWDTGITEGAVWPGVPEAGTAVTVAPVVHVAESAGAARETEVVHAAEVTETVEVTEPVAERARPAADVAPVMEATESIAAINVADPVDATGVVQAAEVTGVMADPANRSIDVTDAADRVIPIQGAELVVPTRPARTEATDVTGFAASTAHGTRPAEDTGIVWSEDTSGIVAGAEVVRAVDVPGVVIRTGHVAEVAGEPVAPRRVAPVREARELPAPLTVASTEWVGESQPPVSPWVPSEFLHNAYREKDRMLVDAYIEENGEAPFVPPTRPAPPPVPVDQPAMPIETPVVAPPVMAPRMRRASLAESRRRGIGVTPAPAGPSTPETTQDEPPLTPQLPDTTLAHQHTTVPPTTEDSVTVQDTHIDIVDPAVDDSTPAGHPSAATQNPPDDIAEPHPVIELDSPDTVHVTETRTIAEQDPPGHVHFTEPHAVIEGDLPGSDLVVEQDPTGSILFTEPPTVAEEEPSRPGLVEQTPPGAILFTQRPTVAEEEPSHPGLVEQTPPGAIAFSQRPPTVIEQDPPRSDLVEQTPPGAIHFTEPPTVAEPAPSSPVVAKQASPGAIHFTQPPTVTEPAPSSPVVAKQASPGAIHFTQPPTVTEPAPSSPVVAKQASPGAIHFTQPPTVTEQNPSSPVVAKQASPGAIHFTQPPTVTEQNPSSPVVAKQASPGAIHFTQPPTVTEQNPSSPGLAKQNPSGSVHFTEPRPVAEQDPPDRGLVTERRPPESIAFTELPTVAKQAPLDPAHITEQQPLGAVLFTEPHPVTEPNPPGPVHVTETPTVTEQDPPGHVHIADEAPPGPVLLTRHHPTQHAPVNVARAEPLPRHYPATRHLPPSTRERPAATEHAQTMTTSARTGTTLLHDPLTVQLAPLDATPPQAVALPLRRALGVDVSGIPIRRGEAVAETARQLNARAFTSDGVVHLPDHAGALDSRDAAPLLAHELTHAVQQQRFGAALPSPGSALATRLEDDAVAIEGWVGGGAVGAPPAVVRQLAPRNDDEDRLPTLDSASLFDEFERVTGERVTLDDGDFELPDVSAHGLLAAWQDIQNMADDDHTDDGGGGSSTGTGAARPGKAVAGTSVDQLIDLIADNPPRRWLDLDDQDNFEEIANRLYNHLLGRLRFDVIVERERSGTLMDFS